MVGEIIDAHSHLGSIPVGKDFIGSFEEYKEVLEKLSVNRFCLTPIGLPENFVENTTPDNDSVLREFENNEKILPVYWFNVFDLPESIDKRFVAIKFHPDIGKVKISDEKVVDFVNKINLPVFVHTNEGKDYSSLGEVAELAKKVNVPVIAVHSGSVTKTLFSFEKYSFPENVFFEISGIQYAAILKRIYGIVGYEKIILGSDYPFGDLRVPLAMLESLNLSKEEHDCIVGENIKKILNIK